MSQETRFRLVAGLGNPGREYEETRHNVGFMIVDLLAQRAGVHFRHESKWDAAVANADGVILCKPQSYMNLSGEPLAAVARFYKIAPEETLAIYDDTALPLGRIRIRPSGSSGGHNGMESILRHVGDIARLRVGIGGAEPGGMVPHVLGRFLPGEREVLAEAMENALKAVDTLQREEIAAAMNQFN